MDTDVITPPWYHPDEYFLGFIPEGIGRRVSLEKRIIRRIVGRQDRSIRIYAGADREECYSKDFYRNIYFYLHIDFVIEGLTQGAYFRLCMHDKDRGEINEENEFNYYPGFFYPPMRGHHLYYAGVVRKLKHLAKKSKLPLYYVGWYYHEFQTFTKQFGFRLANLPENEGVKKTIRRGEEVLIRRGLKRKEPNEWLVRDGDISLLNQSWCFFREEYKNGRGMVIRVPMGIERFTPDNPFVLVYRPNCIN